MRIFSLFLFFTFLTGCSSLRYIENPDKYFELLGETIESKKFEELSKQLDPQETPSIEDQFYNEEFPKSSIYDQIVMFEKNGIQFLLKDNKIVQVKLYMPDPELSFTNYKGQKLPLGIMYSDSEKDVIRKLGTNKNTNNNPDRDVNEYETNKVSVAINRTTNKIIYIELFERPL